MWEGTGESAAQDDADGQAEPWRETYFEAAVDAAEGCRWLSDVVRGDPVGPRLVSQRGWLARGMRVLGLDPDQDDRLAQMVANDLDVAGLEHAEARQRAQAHSLRERGSAVLMVLARLMGESKAWPRLAQAGYRTGVWGRPVFWDALIGQRQFPPGGTPVPEDARPPPREINEMDPSRSRGAALGWPP